MMMHTSSLASRFGAGLATATLGALLLSGCRPSPGSAVVSRTVPADRVILAWRAPLSGPVAQLLDGSAGPAARLVRVPGFTNLAALDAALGRIDGVRPVTVPEPAQAGAVRVLVDRRLAADDSRPALLAELKWSLADGLEGLRREFAREQFSSVGRSPGAGLAMEHRAELFWQLAEGFRALADVPAGAVLTNAPSVAAAHAELAERCAGVARELDLGAGRGARRSADVWSSPGGVAGRVHLGAFAGEWRRRGAAFRPYLPSAPDTNGVTAVAVPEGWLARLALGIGPMSGLQEAIDAAGRAWEGRRQSLRPIAGAPEWRPLFRGLAAECESDRADLEELGRRCEALPAGTIPPEVLASYWNVAMRARRSAGAMARVSEWLQNGSGDLSPAVATTGRE